MNKIDKLEKENKELKQKITQYEGLVELIELRCFKDCRRLSLDIEPVIKYIEGDSNE